MNTQRWLTLMCLATCAPAYAAAAFKPIELKDAEMAELRGRYVMPGRIISFGIVMSSTWTNAAGASMTGTANMQVNATTVAPQFYVHVSGHDGTGSAKQPDGTGTVVGGAGLGTSQGVVQSVRAAGDGNSATNGVDINVTRNGLAPANYVQSGQALVAGQPITGSTAAGQVTVTAQNGGLQLALQANNNQGSVLQQIGGGAVSQGTIIKGDFNAIANSTQLNVVLGSNGLNSLTQNLNLEQLKGLRPSGY